MKASQASEKFKCICYFFLITTNAVQRKKTNSKFRLNELRKFRMFHVINFRIFKIIINVLSVRDCLGNFLNITRKHNEGELK